MSKATSGTHVIILCQGQQKRLPNLPVAKQMLRLPACGDTPILHRTMRQIWQIRGGAKLLRCNADRVVVVAAGTLAEGLRNSVVEVGDGWRLMPEVETLADPGNSSLKGIARYLEVERAVMQRYCERHGFPPRPTLARFARTIVLLGDVVYSWACLEKLFATMPPDRGELFVGTSDLSLSGGELWGVTWTRDYNTTMQDALDGALAKHPPFADYQPGQMRRWLWEVDRSHTYQGPGGGGRTWFAAVDDYTRDIDLPEHVDQLPSLSVYARDDDQAHGVTW